MGMTKQTRNPLGGVIPPRVEAEASHTSPEGQAIVVMSAGAPLGSSLSIHDKVCLLSRIEDLRCRKMISEEHTVLLSSAIARLKDESEPLMKTVRDFLSLAALTRSGVVTSASLSDMVEQYRSLLDPDVST